MSPPAYLLVYSEPGAGVPESLYHDWYDNEHIPLRVATPTFKSWLRLEAIDGQKPRFAAAYDLTSFEDTLAPPYTTLAETRSDREKEIFAKSELFDRRIYDLIETPTTPPSALFDPANAAPIVVFRGLDVKEGTEEEMKKWIFEEHIPMLAKTPGWVRSRLFVLRDAGFVGVDAQKQTKVPTKWLSVHEWADEGFPERPEYKAAATSPQTQRAMEDVIASERRVFRSLREWKQDH